MTDFVRENIVFISGSLLLTGLVVVTSQLQNMRNSVPDSAQVVSVNSTNTNPLQTTPTNALPINIKPVTKTIAPKSIPSSTVNTQRRLRINRQNDD